MEIAYVLGGLALWGAMALMVLGCQRLEKPQGDRS
jgi:hypothetical protein